jgi:FlaA1/EpsC-like NDP-sugar epimerase
MSQDLVLLYASVTFILDKAVLITFIMVLLFSSANVALGLNRMWLSKAKAGNVLPLYFSTAIATSVIFLLNYMLPQPLPATLIIVSGLVAWMGFILLRYRLRLVSGAARHWLNARHLLR